MQVHCKAGGQLGEPPVTVKTASPLHEPPVFLQIFAFDIALAESVEVQSPLHYFGSHKSNVLSDHFRETEG